jgi:hypothetical protein
MEHNSKLNKIENPQSSFDHPNDVVKDRQLSPGEKQDALNTWEQDARQLLTASDEGMPGSEEGVEQKDSHRLGEVVRAKVKIGAKSNPKASH